MNSKILIILGMHRSSTSLLTKWINRCGINIGDKLLEGDVGNIDGHFEDYDFFNLHMDILNQNNLPGGGVTFPFEKNFDFEGFNKIHVNDYFKEKAKSIIEFKSKLHSQFAWKDPRTCLFINLYHEIVPDAKYICVFKNYNVVVNSMINRDIRYFKERIYSTKFGKLRYYIIKNSVNNKIKKTFNTHLGAWIKYNHEILNLTDKIPKKNYLLFSGDELLKEEFSDKVLNKIKEWGFSVDKIPYKNFYNIKRVTKKSRKFNYDINLLEQANSLEKKIKKIITKL